MTQIQDFLLKNLNAYHAVRSLVENFRLMYARDTTYFTVGIQMLTTMLQILVENLVKNANPISKMNKDFGLVIIL